MAQVVGRLSVGREISGSIPGASHLSGCRSHLRPPGAGIGSRSSRSLKEEKQKELSYKTATMPRWREE